MPVWPAHPLQFVAVDVETTGLYTSDRVVEVAAVTVSADGRIVDEWDTLVNPERDVGPTSIHGITASMVSTAPRFNEVASALAARMDGSILVAHNLSFDSRMLVAEYGRLRARLLPGQGVCTLSACGERLDQACARRGIKLPHHHRALADARASAALLQTMVRGVDGYVPAAVEGLDGRVCPRTLRRDVLGDQSNQMPFLARLATQARLRAERGPSLAYLDLLDWALADLELSVEESAGLKTLARELGMSAQDVESAHRRYFDELVGAAVRDGMVTDDEAHLLERLAVVLGLPGEAVAAAKATCGGSGASVLLVSGMTVCFTGEACHTDGTELPRDLLCQLAESFQLRPVSSVTKSGCDLVVAADPSSLSGKAEKARKWGIPVVDVMDFLRAEPGALIPARLSATQVSARNPSLRDGRPTSKRAVEVETLTCGQCGQEWQHAVARGRKPTFCPNCV